MSVTPLAPHDLLTQPRLPDVEGVTHHWANVRGLRMHYAQAGEGEALVLLHGWPQHWWCWRHLIGPLSQRYRVICPDQRGMGWTDGAPRGYTWHDMALDLADLLDEIGVGEFRLVGHDWGLVVGYRAVLNWPQRIRQFVALGGIHPWSLDGAQLRLALAPWHVYLIALLGGAASERIRLTERCLTAWRHTGTFTLEETQVYMSVMRQPKCVSATVQFDRNVVRRELPHLARHYRHLRNHVPTLHLNGQQDPLLPEVPTTYRKYADRMCLDVVPNCGHFIAEEQPQLLLDRIQAFFAEGDGP